MNSIIYNGLGFALVIGSLLIFYMLLKRSILSIAMLAFFIICLILIITNYIWSYLPGEKLIFDSLRYYLIASQISSNLSQNFLATIIADYGFLDVPSYTLPLGVLYYVFGPSFIVGQLLSVLGGIGIIWNLDHLACRLFNRRVANVTIIMLLFCPYLWYLSIILLRDTIIIFFITLFFRMLAEIPFRSSSTAKIGHYSIAIAAMVYLGLLRAPLLIILMLSFITFVVAATKIKTKLKIIIFFIIIICGSIGILSYAKIDKTSLLATGLSYMEIKHINEQLDNEKEHTESFYKNGVHYNNIMDVAKNIFKDMLYFLYSPLPWMIQKAKYLLGLIDSVQIMILTYFSVKGFKILYKYRQDFVLSLLVFILFGVGVGGILVHNMGSAMRYRSMFTFVIFPIAAYGLLEFWQKFKAHTHFADQISPGEIGDVD